LGPAKTKGHQKTNQETDQAVTHDWKTRNILKRLQIPGHVL
jgi:hypothetical protein